jgi:mono/diheme cytochrome c family protein
LVRWRTEADRCAAILAAQTEGSLIVGFRTDKKAISPAGQHGYQGEAMTRSHLFRPTMATLLACTVISPMAHGATAAELEAAYTAQSGTSASPARGQELFTTRHGREWSCSSCHGAVPIRAGGHAATGKPIAPLAPAFNTERLTDGAKTEKWFRRNCNDVVGRECSAAEKADVISWLRTLKP